jgi:DNA-binding NarL/FixJ family response regulator
MKNDDSRLIRILLVDDKPLIREGMAAILGRQDGMEVVAEAANGREGIEQYRRFQPTITLMDLSMPVMDGITATDAIVREFPAARILILSSDLSAEYKSLKAGAAAFLPKDASRSELVETIHAVCNA